MENTFPIREFVRKIAEENNFLNLDEPELIDLSQSPIRLPTFSSPSSVSSDSTVINDTFPPSPPTPISSPIQSLLSTTSSSPSMPTTTTAATAAAATTVFTFSPSLRWLLPSQCDSPLTVVWPKNNNNYASTSEFVNLSSLSPKPQSEQETIANTLFQNNIQEEMYNDNECLEILQEWYKESEENHTADHQTNDTLSLKRKRK